jgi:hypothetical protein
MKEKKSKKSKVGRPKKEKKSETLPAVVDKTSVVKATDGVRAISSVDPQALLARAIDQNLPIESMERLLAMRKEMKAEWARDQFFAALAGFQHECPTVTKDKKVLNKDKVSTRYTYAPLEDIVDHVKPFLQKWGFSWTIKPKQMDGHVRASCYAHHKDGHEELTEFEVPLDPDAYMSNPQKAAAALTFARRYAFINAFGIVTKGEDTDAIDDDEPKRKTPIQQPKATVQDAIPVQHEVKDIGPYGTIIRCLGATEIAPGTKLTVRIFTEEEATDYRIQADQAKNNNEELAVILKNIIAVGTTRRKAIKGE